MRHAEQLMIRRPNTLYDIIPDIHGQSEKLHALLDDLGWRRHASGWVNDMPEREIVFLGDFIDRGPDNAGVLRTVRSLIDDGKAQAVMGNHELNAIHFHTKDPETGVPLRAYSEKNIAQQASFLAEFPEGASQTVDWIAWMASLPVFLELPNFRAVHACWDETTISKLSDITSQGSLSKEQIVDASRKGQPLFDFLETTTKGPEVALPDGYSFTDKGGAIRRHVRVKWWTGEATTWRDIAMSVPNASDLPSDPLPADIANMAYPSDAKPVFFGHYWLRGEPVLQAANALCLDYSAGLDGPLVAYRFEAGDEVLDLGRVIGHGLG
jgi:hypothetical protein